MRHERIWYPGSILWLMVMMACGGAGLEEGESEPWRVGDEMPVIASPTDDAPTMDEVETSPVVTPRPVFEETSCELEHAYNRNDGSYRVSYWAEPRLLGLTPGGGLVVIGSSAVRDAAAVPAAGGDREHFETLSVPGLRAVDADWSVGIDRVAHRHWEVRDLDTDRRLALVEPAEGNQIMSSALSRDGRTAGFVECGSGGPILRFLSLEAGGGESSVELDTDQQCYYYDTVALRLAFTDDSRFAVATTGPSMLWSIDLESMEVRGVAAGSPEEPHIPGLYDIAVRPGAHEVATTSAEGLMRWSLPDLEPLDEAIEVGSWLINEYAYAPRYRASPVTWTPDGRELVYANVDGDIVLGDGRQVLEGVEIEPTPRWDDAPDAPVALSFDRHHGRLVVARYGGVEIYGCPGESIAQTSDIQIRLTGEARIEGHVARIPFEVWGGEPVYGLRLSVDGERWSIRVQDDELVVWWAERETVELVVTADDGVSTADARVRLSFVE